MSPTPTRSNRTATALLIVLGAVVAGLGAAAAAAALASHGGVVLLVVGVVALVVGAFVFLVGQGARRQLMARDRARAERDLDDRILAAAAEADGCRHDPSGCDSCGAACALAGLRPERSA